jgi:soluble lytic murein transglycosylase
LHDPDIAITLGAAYLAELERFFDGNIPQVVSAYNAGEDLARLWLSYCFSHDSAEYFTKIGYAQTRNYLAKVLSSREQYREIYAQTSN